MYFRWNFNSVLKKFLTQTNKFFFTKTAWKIPYWHQCILMPNEVTHINFYTHRDKKVAKSVLREKVRTAESHF